MKQKNIQNLVIAALFAAIICVATFVVKIPSPATNGYLNLGDCFVLLAGFLLNPLYAVLAAGIGSALADVLAGYAQYAPATFIIKALMALSVFIIIKAFSNKFTIVSKLCSGFAAEAVMVLGYFGYEALVLGYGVSAASGILPNVLQGAVGIITAFIIMKAITKSKALSSLFMKGKS